MDMKYIAAILALGLGACGQAGDVRTADAANTVSQSVQSSVSSSNSSNVTSSVQSHNSSTVNSSSNVGSTSSNISSTVNGNESSCSTELNGKRCEISCRAPKVARCSNKSTRAGPSCRCAR